MLLFINKHIFVVHLKDLPNCMSGIFKVTDSGGLSDSVLVTVHVADVNDESPICDPQQYDLTVSVKDQPGKLVATLKCTDRDFSPEFNTLSYSLDGDLTIITGKLFCLFDLILYVPSMIFQLCRDWSSWVEPVIS